MTKTLKARPSTAPKLRPGARIKPAGGASRKDAGNEFRGEQTSVVQQTLRAALDRGLIGSKDERITARLSHALVEQAKRRTGIKGDTELIEFALANVALEDDFTATMHKLDGTIDPDVKLGF